MPAPARADCADVLSSIQANVNTFAVKRGELLDTLNALAAAEPDDDTAEIVEVAYSLRETVSGLADKISEHGALVSEACIPHE